MNITPKSFRTSNPHRLRLGRRKIAAAAILTALAMGFMLSAFVGPSSNSKPAQVTATGQKR
ncbi:MAG: hypothetical protein RL291_78 [Pseudomonadota bacterium]